MRLLIRLSLLLLVLLLAACAATVTKPSGQAQIQPATSVRTLVLLITGNSAVQSSANWHTFRAEWRTAFEAAAGARGLSTSYIEAEPSDLPSGTVLVRIAINRYRYLSPGVRFGFGVMTGNAFIDADVAFVEFPGAKQIGTRKFSTSSSAWEGIFSAMTNKQVRAISDEIVAEFANK